MVVAVVSVGVTPAEVTAMVGLIEPYQYSTPAPDVAEPMPIYVSVSEGEPVEVGNVMVEIGTAAFPVIVQPGDPLFLVTATRP